MTEKNVMCNRSGKASTSSIDGTPRPLAAGPLKQKCEWKLELDPYVKMSYYTKASKLRQYKDQWDKPVTITVSSCIHTNGCTPGRANRVAVTSASGSYVKKIPTQKLFGHYAILSTRE